MPTVINLLRGGHADERGVGGEGEGDRRGARVRDMGVRKYSSNYLSYKNPIASL